ncbi:MAG TPA: SDR family NAD(P)-dependent oxidoreductase [Solirubrobacteraceae bacterium]|nr:SDR family NAD(P)-dependent oxidoreductase [Solirubrobacteraceae bacterium]
MRDAEDRTAIVTGAAGGVGRAVVRLLRESGVRVVAEDVDPDVRELADADDGVAALVADVRAPQTARDAVALALERFGGLHVLVNNAGVFLGKPIDQTTDEDWDLLMEVNVKSVFRHCREALGHMLEQGSGAIVNTASISGLIGLPDQVAYCATKGAIVQITRQLAVECSGRGVRVNAVAPGAIRGHFIPGATDELWDAIGPSHPLGRCATNDEIAQVIAFLASPAASFVSGAIVAADGAYTAQ